MKYSNRRSRRQNGISTALLAVFLGTSAASLGTVAVGQHYWEQGRIQKVVDMAAIAAARELHAGPPFALGNAVAAENGLQGDEAINFACMVNNGVDAPFATNDCSVANAISATSTRDVNSFFFVDGQAVNASATAVQAPSVVGVFQSTLRAQGLAGLNARLLGGDPLVDGSFQFSILDFAASLGLNRLSMLEDSSFSPNFIVDAALEAADLSPLELNSDWFDALQNLLAESPNVMLGDIFELALGNQLQGQLNIRLDDLLRALGISALVGQTVQIVGAEETYALEEPIYLSELYRVEGIRNLRAKVLAAPEIFMGRKVPGGGQVFQMQGAQLRVDLDLEILGDADRFSWLSKAVRVETDPVFHVGVRLEGVGGQVELSDFICEAPDSGSLIDARITPSTYSMSICPCDEEEPLPSVVQLEVTEILNRDKFKGPLAPIKNEVQVEDFAPVRLELVKYHPDEPLACHITGPTTQVNFTGNEFPHVFRQAVDAGNGVYSIFGWFQDYTLQVAPESQDSLLMDAIDDHWLQKKAKLYLGPALGEIAEVLDSALLSAGLELNSAELRVNQVDCDSVVLAR